MAKKKKIKKTVVKQQIRCFFSEAGKVFRKKPALADRYVRKARGLGMAHRVRLPQDLKRTYCKHCKHYLQPGVNATVRLSQKRQSKLVVTCSNCGGIMRYPYKS